MFYLFAIFAFIFGTMLGSFFGVILYRYGHEEWEWWQGRSKCDACGQQLAWFDNIPLFSFLHLRGKCRFCGKKIDPVYFYLELFTGCFLLIVHVILWPVLFELWLAYLFWLIVLLVMWLIVLFDGFYMIIPDKLVAILYLLSGFFLLWQGQQNWQEYNFSSTFIVIVLVELLFLGLWLGTKRKGFGDGDVKLIGPLILLMGYPHAVVGVFLAFILGAVYGILLMVIKNKNLKQAVPFGPFLILGCWIALLWGKQIWQWYWQLLV